MSEKETTYRMTRASAFSVFMRWMRTAAAQSVKRRALQRLLLLVQASSAQPTPFHRVPLQHQRRGTYRPTAYTHTRTIYLYM